jgi:polysaccharide export outer membrane protein
MENANLLMNISFPVWRMFRFCGLGCLVLVIILCSSCANTRQLTYLQGKFDTAQLSKIDLKEPVIKRGDLLSIIVYSDNPEATALFNQAQIGNTPAGNSGGITGAAASALGASSSGGGNPGSGGYLVDESGNIEFQGLGVIHVEGFLRRELKDSLEQRLKEFLKDPYCTIRFLNYRFTMLGEIARPGVFNIPGEHINLLEALGLGGDLTFYGRRDNILVIRENNGRREFGRVDLTKPEVMGSPYFNLQANDLVYIEATRKKVAANDQTAIRTITITTAVISTLALLYSLFR